MDHGVTITRGRKFDQVLEGARRVFVRDGFEGASVDDIARELGVSKATLYSYFPDKRLMFSEVFRLELRRENAEGLSLVEMAMPPAQALPIVSRMIAGHMISELGSRLYRLAVAESARFPTLAQEYYTSGTLTLRRSLVAGFAQWASEGLLVIDDYDIAAEQFVELSLVMLRDQRLLLNGADIDEALIDRVCDSAVRVFLAAYGPQAGA